MVGPVSQAEREETTKKVKLAFTALVGLSAGLVSLQMDPSPAMFVGAVVGGLLLGGPLIWYVFPDTSALDRSQSRERR